MSTILKYTNKYNIPLTNKQKEKLESAEVLLNLSDLTFTIIGNALVIRTKYHSYFMYRFFNVDIYNLNIYNENNEIEENLEDDFIKLLNYTIKHITRR